MSKFFQKYNTEVVFSIRLYNDRKKEMLVIQDRDYQQVLAFVEAFHKTDQDYCITNQITLEKIQKSEVEKELLPSIVINNFLIRQTSYFCGSFMMELEFNQDKYDLSKYETTEYLPIEIAETKHSFIMFIPKFLKE